MTDERELGLAAYRTRRELFAAAGLPTADEVPPPDDRFARARQLLGPGHPAVQAAVAARNALAETARPIVRAVARAYSERVGALERADAVQAGAEGAQRAAELYLPSAGAWRSYARRWIVKRISAAADGSRAVRIGERARLAGSRVEVVDLEHQHLEAEPELARLEALASAEADVERLEEALDRLGPLERAAVVAAHGLDGREPLPPKQAAAALKVGAGRFAAALARGHEQLGAYLRGEQPAERPQLGLFELTT